MMRSALVALRPLGVEVEVELGFPLADVLVKHGGEFPCGGHGRCRGCRVRVLKGNLEQTSGDRVQLSEAERSDGWRLACQAHCLEDLTIELRQWAGLILADETPFPFEPASGLGVAVDVGTTTLVAQLLDCSSGKVLGTQTALNPQARFGADVMSRIRAALEPEGRERLTRSVREQVAGMVTELLKTAPPRAQVLRATLVGNTVMQHLFLGLDVGPLAAHPFEPRFGGGCFRRGSELGWPSAAQRTRTLFLPNLGGFVGSDILGVILATRMHESEAMTGAVDLGTNGEVVFGDRDRMVVTSTAAGPAFEGARISQGMRAAPGAIDRVTANGRGVRTHVIGGGAPRGLCGSGLVDAVACGLEQEWIAPSGWMPGQRFPLRRPVVLLQQDVRELQLAKGAIAAGIQLLMEYLQTSPERVSRFFLAGAFGNNLSPENARRIGLLPFPPAVIQPVGNAALLGAKIALFMPELGMRLFDTLLPRIRNLSLEQSPDFQDQFAQAMAFPERSRECV